MLRPAYAVTGELPSVIAGSGVGDRAARAPSTVRWGGRKRGGEGDEVAVGPSDVMT